MKDFTERDYRLFEALVNFKEGKKLLNSLNNTIKDYGFSNIVKKDEYLYAQGTLPVLLVAHVDTVFKFPPSEIFFDRIKKVIFGTNGLGADDRAGVYAILKILKDGFLPSVLFTDGEECGGIGIDAFIKDYPSPNIDIKYIVELDRQAKNDCVFYCCDNTDFISFVENYGFKEQYGTYSDIADLMPEWKIAGVNLSIGYLREHTLSETLYVKHMMSTIEKVENMLKECALKTVPKFNFIPSIEYLNYSKMFNKIEIIKNTPNLEVKEMISTCTCAFCQGKFYDFDVLEIDTLDNKTINVCIDCFSYLEQDKYDFCNICGRIYEKAQKDQEVCNKCITNSTKKN